MRVAAAHFLLSACLAAASNRSTTSTTIMDVLSRDPRFSSLIHALQVAQLIPYLNNRTDEGRTIFAPTNDAFARRDGSWHDVCRELLLYHTVPSTVRLADLTEGHLLRTSLVLDGALGADYGGQRLKVTRHNDGQVIVGQTTIIEGDLTADNGIVHVIDALLDTPVDVLKTLSLTEGISNLNIAIRESGFSEYLPSTTPWTVFAPVDSAFDGIQPLTRQYLKTIYAKDDLQSILKYHTHRGAYYVAELPEGTSSIPAMAGGTRELAKNKKTREVTYDRAPLLETDIVASNGAVHIIPQIFLPSTFEMDALKYLIGMNRTKFVDMFIDAGLTGYLTRHSPSAPITVFTPANEVLEGLAVPTKEQLLYHVVPGWYEFDDFQDNDIIPTALKTRELLGQAQVLHVMVTRNEDREVLINDARIISKPVVVEGAVIYTTSHMFSLPLEPLQVILSDLNLSTFAAAVHITDLELTLRTQPGTTVFVPSNDAFTRDSAVMSYLLLPSVAADFRAVVGYHVATHLLYASDIPRTGTSGLALATLSGQNVTLRGGDNRDDLVLLGSQPHAAHFRSYPPRNKLTANGNIFVIDRLMFPDIDITIRNLLKVLNAPTFVRLVTDYLSGDASISPLDASQDNPVTVLVPSEAAFARLDLDSLVRHPARMACSVKMHFVRGRAELTDGGVWDTFCEQGWIKVHSVGDNAWVLDVVDRSGQAIGGKELGRARVGKRGEARNGNVYEVDRFFHLPDSRGLAWYWILLLILGCLTLVAALFVLWRYIQLRRRRSGYVEVLDPE